jgi:cupin fold WbuC family metalloprotein
MLIKISTTELNHLIDQAKQSERKRKNFNFHKNPDDLFQRMLHALNPGTYIQPHKHEAPDKREVFIILQGRVAVMEFDDDGEITDFVILDRNKGNYGVEVPAHIWHTLIALEKDTVVYEAKDGPYSPVNDKKFAPWAPIEGEDKCRNYLDSLFNGIDI